MVSDRRFVRKLLDGEMPETQVVSVADLMTEVALRPIARAHLGVIGE